VIFKSRKALSGILSEPPSANKVQPESYSKIPLIIQSSKIQEHTRGASIEEEKKSPMIVLSQEVAEHNFEG